MQVFIIIFSWLSIILLDLAAVIILYEFLEERIPVWRKKSHNEPKQP